MRIKVRAKLGSSKTAEPARPHYPLRVSSFLVSVAAHCLGIAGLALVTFPAVLPDRPVYDELIEPHEHQIVFYHLRDKAPDVAPLVRSGPEPRPQGSERSELTVVATAPKPKSEQVFISVPAPALEIHEDMPAPLLVARLDTTLPPPPSAPPKPKKFVPPPPLKREPKLPIQTPVLDASAPRLDSVPAEAPPSATALPVPNAAPPPKIAPAAQTVHTGNANADIAVASLHPNPKAEVPIPNGERPGAFSKAPIQGTAASGEPVQTAKLVVPNLTIRQPKEKPAPPAPATEILYAERVRSVPLSTLSVPLRPANRMIPQEVDARFPGRNVYTIVIPMEHMPVYGGDWIMWFADRGSKPGQTPVVRAPLPFRKREPLDAAPPGDRTKERIQFAATLDKNGMLEGITLLTRVTPAIQRVVFQDMTEWEFHSATRDGEPVDVDVVLEIPFNLPVAVAKSEQ